MKKLLSLILVLLSLCFLGCEKDDKPDLPRPAEDTSIVGTYVFSHAFFRPGAELPQSPPIGVSEVDAMNNERRREDYIKNRESEWYNKAFRFDADGVFLYQQRYTEEVYNSGCFVYDGENLNLYSFIGEPYAPPLQVPVIEAEFENNLLMIYFDDTYGLTFMRVKDTPAS